MKINHIIISIIAIILCTSCSKFATWKEINEEWMAAKRAEFEQKVDGEHFVILPSGICIEKIHTGYGAVPKAEVDPVRGTSSAVRVAVMGDLVDGTRFQNSENVTYYLSETIDGWKETISQMPQGSHWKFYIPYTEGYDEDGLCDVSGNFAVPPYSTLIFEIELIDVINF